jgi:phosphate regulon transcriptional regulator PhoB
MNTKILVVDDEKDLLQLIKYNLEKEGYSVTESYNGEDALKKIKKEPFNLIILDLMLPGMQGTELCKILRSSEETSAIPIIMLTAKSEDIDKVLGLELGADDYITKPFSPRELIARVKAVMRRTQKQPHKDKVLIVGDISINTDTCQVTKKKKPINLSATEFRLLTYLAERKGRIFNRDMLLDAIWKDETYVEPRTVDVHIRRLRSRIEDDPSRPVYIKTRRGIGYYLEENS